LIPVLFPFLFPLSPSLCPSSRPPPGTKLTEFIGSHMYMAPEVINKSYSAEADVWSAGVVLYVLLAGVPPFWASTESGVLDAIVSKPLNFSFPPWPFISVDAKDLIKQMLKKDPAERITLDGVLGPPPIDPLPPQGPSPSGVSQVDPLPGTVPVEVAVDSGAEPEGADLGLQITRDRARRTITLTHSHMVQQVLQRFGFRYSSPQSTPLPSGHSLSAPPLDKSVELSGPYLELVGCLMYLMTCTRPDFAYPLSILARYVASGRHQPEHWEAAKRVLRYLCSTSGMGLVLGGRGPVVLTGHADASWVDDLATQWSSQGYTFSLSSGSVSWRSTRSSSFLSSICEAKIYARAMAAQELRWLTYLLTDLGERPCSSPVLYVENKAIIDLCQEHRLEHRTKHIALCYFLARELQQRGQLHLAYVATRANTADIFTKALQSGDHQRFCTVLGLVPTLPHLLTT
ncbi:unnamed protein product, partial [Closterium sp. NIES-53]